MLCAAIVIAIARRERPWWLWAIGLLLLGITRIHL
jgi:hypothetical protein